MIDNENKKIANRLLKLAGQEIKPDTKSKTPEDRNRNLIRDFVLGQGTFAYLKKI